MLTLQLSWRVETCRRRPPFLLNLSKYNRWAPVYQSTCTAKSTVAVLDTKSAVQTARQNEISKRTIPENFREQRAKREEHGHLHAWISLQKWQDINNAIDSIRKDEILSKRVVLRTFSSRVTVST